ncbi:MAG: hypothetical protein KC547_01400 [Anaerolineae bacterium]|nr:hypothetical protein [Anaerolineae bacterium]
MRTFGLRLSITLVLILALVSGAALAAGRVLRPPEDGRAALIAWCEMSPCVMDIVPGETDWTRTQGQLDDLPDRVLLPRQIVVRQDFIALEFYPSVNGESVGRIFLHFPQNHHFDAGWIVQRFGEPCGVSIYPASGQITLRYPFLLANVDVDDNRLRPQSAVSMISLQDPHFRFEVQPDPCIDNITSRQMLNSPWKGFSTITYYRAHQQ